jgi:Ca2+-binding RTX toxin-like protein
VDVLAALRDALAAGTASAWQQGPLATQARVEVDLPGSQRLLFDVTLFRDGNFSVQAQFNNDQAMGATGGRVNFEAVARMDGVEVMRKTVSQGQYQNWREHFASSEANGGQGSGDPGAGWLNIRHDLGYLQDTGAVAHYDKTIGIPESLIQGWVNKAATTPGWGDALAPNNIRQDMGAPGGREDIGIVTAGNTAWLMSQDPRAAQYALDQAEVSGAIPWNFYDSANRTWLNTDAYPRLWTDARGGTGIGGDRNSGGLTQQVGADTGWEVARSHQPELSFVPYLLTGERMHLDAVQSQAAFSLMSSWAFPRESDGNLLLANGSQLRSSAWAMRQVDNALWASPEGSQERAFWQKVSDQNWDHLLSKLPEWTALQGEAHGWVLGQDSTAGSITQFGQDYFAAITIQAASRGNLKALEVLEWQSNFLIGRFLNADNGFNPRDGVAYQIATGVEGTFQPFKTWAEIGAATVARGMSNGTDSWVHSNGEYGRLAMASLAGIWHLTGNPEALRAYQLIAAEAPSWTSEGFFALRPNYAITIEGVYGGTIVGTAGDDTISPGRGTPNLRADLGAGFDTLNLGNAVGNEGFVRNVEVLNGNAGNDLILLTAAVGGTTVDLRGGTDVLTLADGGNTVRVANTETILGGAGADIVTLATAGALEADLAGGDDRLRLADGTNTLRASNIETIEGGAGNDTVTLLTQALAGHVVDLGGGADRLVLSQFVNTLLVRNTETILGANAQDDITLGTAITGGSVDLGGSTDILRLANGTNSLSVAGAETILGGAGNDSVTLATTFLHGATLFDLGGGNDTLRLANGSNRLTASGVETLLGGTGADDVTLVGTLTNAPPGALVDLGAGTDRLTLNPLGPAQLRVANTEAIQGSAADETVALVTAAAASLVVDLNGGNDRLILANLTNSLTVRGAETIIGGSAADTVTLGTTALAGSMFDLGGGADRLVLGQGNNIALVRNTETIEGQAGADDITLGTMLAGGRVDLNGGLDTLRLAAGNNIMTVLGVDTLLGGIGNDSITLGEAAPFNMRVDLGAGNDTLRLASATNTLSVGGTETILGGAGNDGLTLLGGAMDALVDLGAGTDRLTLSGGDMAVRVRHVEAIQGSAAAEVVALLAAANGLVVDLNGGADRLVLANVTNILTVRSVETIQGGSSADTVTLGTVMLAGSLVDLGSGADTLALAAGANVLTLRNVETITASSGGNDITLGTVITGGLVDLGGGGSDRLLLAAGNNSLTVRDVDLVLGNTGNDAISATGGTAARIEGRAGNDALRGGDGADRLVGGTGQDVMTGGLGQDWFIFTAVTDSSALLPDTIADFNAAQGDRLVFEGLLDTAFTWRGTGAFVADGRSQGRYVEASRRLEIDLDGNRSVDMAVTLTGVTAASLSANAFIWS